MLRVSSHSTKDIIFQLRSWFEGTVQVVHLRRSSDTMGIKCSGPELYFSALTLFTSCDRYLLNSDAVERRYIKPDWFNAESDGNA